MNTTAPDRRRACVFFPRIISILAGACALLFCSLPALAEGPDTWSSDVPRSADQAGSTARIDSLSSCIYAANVDFGSVGKGEQKTVRFTICNTGQGTIRFQPPYASSQLSEFSIAQSELDKLKNTVLAPGNCVELAVSFQAATVGTYRNVVRFWATTRNCRDTSVMTAIVSQAAPALTGADFGANRLTALNPCSKGTGSGYPADVTVSNAGGRSFTVAKMELVGADADAGFFKLDQSNPATTVNVGDVINPGAARQQRVLFLPKDERPYSAKLRLITNATPPDTIESPLAGIGTEAHISITDLNFGTFSFTNPGDPGAPGTVQLTATNATRPVTITNVRLGAGTDFAVAGFRRADNSPVTLPFTMTPNETVTIDLRFQAQSASPEQKSTDVIVEGDFSRCDDSLGALTGTVNQVTSMVSWTRQEGSSAGAARVSPNPVATVGTIAVELQGATHALVEIFDGSGARVASLLDRMVEGGRQELRWDASALPSGIYYCRVTAGRTQSTRAILVMR